MSDLYKLGQSPSLGTINGTIEDNKGTPIVGAIVILYQVTGNPDSPTLIPIRYTRTITDGTYLFDKVPQGQYIVKANKEQ